MKFYRFSKLEMIYDNLNNWKKNLKSSHSDGLKPARGLALLAQPNGQSGAGGRGRSTQRGARWRDHRALTWLGGAAADNTVMARLAVGLHVEHGGEKWVAPDKLMVAGSHRGGRSTARWFGGGEATSF
jgi:hypothetical protein